MMAIGIADLTELQLAGLAEDDDDLTTGILRRMVSRGGLVSCPIHGTIPLDSCSLCRSIERTLMACPGNVSGCSGTVYSAISKTRIPCGHPAPPPPKKK